jgi:hypothetical protein
VTISAALRDCLDDIHWDANDLALCVFQRGIPAGGNNMPLPQVQAEISYIQTHNACRFQNTERTVFLDHIGECLAQSDPIHLGTLKFWLGLLPLNPFFYGP